MPDLRCWGIENMKDIPEQMTDYQIVAKAPEVRY